MDYRSQEDHDMGNMPAVSLGYNPPHPIRVSAFSKPSPLLSTSSSLLSPKDHGPSRNGSTGIIDHGPSAAASDHHPADPVPLPVAAGASAATGSNPKATTAVKYRQCLRNHAAAIGGHVLDGCCEFMPGDADPLKCAACDCHRSFHRKQTEGDSSGAAGSYYRRDRISVPLLLPPPHPAANTNHNYHKQFASSAAAFPPSPTPGSSAMVAFGGNTSGSGATTESSSEERLDASVPPPLIVSKKRFRTKFTSEQKERMLGFAESVGWRIQRQDETTVEQFCKEIGVRRQVLKVWMHNNKHAIKKQQEEEQLQQLQMRAEQQEQVQQQQHLQQQQSLGM